MIDNKIFADEIIIFYQSKTPASKIYFETQLMSYFGEERANKIIEKLRGCFY